MRKLRIGMAQINTTVGDFKGNAAKILETVSQAKAMGVDLLTFPELATCGYPPEDLLFKSRFVEENLRCRDRVVEASAGITIVLGFVDRNEGIYDAAAVINDTKLAGVYHKIYLPNYGVFDEYRYFKQGSACPIYVIAGVNVGVNVCEDIWFDDGPDTVQAYSGAEVIANISASPYHYGKGNLREEMLLSRAARNLSIIAYTNLVGGQDELVFDGKSMVVDEKGNLIARGRQFEEDLLVVDLDIDAVARARRDDPGWKDGKRPLGKQRWSVSRVTVSTAPPVERKPPLSERRLEKLEADGEVYEALVLGTRDYIRKNGFEKVLIGLSGGLDSSLVAAIAVDAIGSQNVVGVTMPSRYSSEGSVADSELLAENLGIELLNIPIEPVFKSYLEVLNERFKGNEPNVAEENIQARIRGNIAMALSNKFGWLVLTTGNKSEMATGYATLYGDMAGGFAVIKDVPKTLAYRLAIYRNSVSGTELIPSSVIEKPPSAELRPDQKDTDSLPPYDTLDLVLTAYVEEDKSVEQIIAMGFDEEVVRRATRLVDTSEYKRRQAPPGIKITPRAFGKDRRLPITNRFRGY